MAGPHQPYGCPTRPALTKSYVCMYVCMYGLLLFLFKLHSAQILSTTEAAIFVYRNLARAVGIQMRSLTDSCHRIKNRPIKSLRHQCAGHQKFNMKPLQSLFSPPLFADRGFAAYRSSISQQKRDCSQSRMGYILGFHVTSQALLKSVSAMLVSLGCQIYANNSPFLQ